LQRHEAHLDAPLTQVLAQPIQRLGNSPGNRGLRNALLGCYLDGASALQKMAPEQFLLVFGQSLQRLIYRWFNLRPGTGTATGIRGINRFAASPGNILPNQVHCAPRCHFVQPAPQRARNPIGLLRQLEEGLLRRVGRLRLIAQNTPAGRIDHVRIPTHNDRKGAVIAAPGKPAN
jgi:hypothetical protein